MVRSLVVVNQESKYEISILQQMEKPMGRLQERANRMGTKRTKEVLLSD